jgi:hypothetical protein
MGIEESQLPFFFHLLFFSFPLCPMDGLLNDPAGRQIAMAGAAVVFAIFLM